MLLDFTLAKDLNLDTDLEADKEKTPKGQKCSNINNNNIDVKCNDTLTIKPVYVEYYALYLNHNYHLR